MFDYFVSAETPQLIDIGSSEINEIISYVQMIFTDFMPILTLIFGVFLGVLVIKVLFNILTGRN